MKRCKLKCLTYAAGAAIIIYMVIHTLSPYSYHLGPAFRRDLGEALYVHVNITPHSVNRPASQDSRNASQFKIAENASISLPLQEQHMQPMGEAFQHNKLDDVTVADTLHTDTRSAKQQDFIHVTDTSKAHEEPRERFFTLCVAVDKITSMFSQWDVQNPSIKEQPEDCRKDCAERDFLFATLFRGLCFCTNLPPVKTSLVSYDLCNATCSGNVTACDLLRKPHAITMKAMSRDGYQEWTTWMSLTALRVKVRYRNCKRDHHSLECVDTVIERSAMQGKNEPLTFPASHYLGCFTGNSIVQDERLQVATLKNTIRVYSECLKKCIAENKEIDKEQQKLFAAVEAKPLRQAKYVKCYCLSSLELSQPTDTCSIGLGLAIFSTLSNSTQHELVFTTPKTKQGNILVIARFRSGSSMTQSLFVRLPNVISYFEPCRLKADSYSLSSDVDVLAGMQAIYSCDSNKVYSFIYNSAYQRWSNMMLNLRGQDTNLVNTVLDCILNKPRSLCLPFWKEACDRASFINVKLIRVHNSTAIREFIIRNPEIHVVHLVRDPRGIMASQKAFGGHQMPSELCSKMAAMGYMIKSLYSQNQRNAHEVYYEELALQPLYYAKKLYDEIGIAMPEEVESFLRREEYGNGSNIPKNASQVVVKDPKYHMFRFLQRNKMEYILDVDHSCQNVYNLWQGRYTNLGDLYKSHKADVLRYMSESNRLWLEKNWNIRPKSAKDQTQRS